MRLGTMPSFGKHITPQFWIPDEGVQMANREKWREDVLASLLVSAGWTSRKKIQWGFSRGTCERIRAEAARLAATPTFLPLTQLAIVILGAPPS